MGKIIKTGIFLFIIVGLFFSVSLVVKAEVINDFRSTITVSKDASITVQEKIVYDFEGAIKHGIYRDISLLNSKNEPMEINVISVKDQNGQSYPFVNTLSDKNINIRIGDPNVTLSGIKEYDITYRVLGAIGYYQNYDEIYWNVTGNNWQVPINQSSAVVLLPNNIIPKQQACYYGRKGNTSQCQINFPSNFFTPTILSSGQGLTVAVGFEKGIVSIYQPKIDSNFVKFVKILKIFWPILFPILFLIFMFREWYKKGRDPKGTGVIVAQYDVPDELTPLEVVGIIDQKIKNKNISAEIIYLATMGYLKIKQTEEKTLGVFTKKDYTLTLLKESKDLQNSFDKDILDALFEEEAKIGGTVNLSSLNSKFFVEIPAIKTGVFESLVSKKYYTNLAIPFFPFIFGKGNLIKKIWIVGIFFSAGYIFLNEFPESESIWVIFFSAIAIGIMWVIFQKILPAKSQQGVAANEYLLGLKLYLEIAEKDRLKFHNAPEKKPEIFEKLLPYAMIFGVEKLWAEEFKDIYINPPSWYEGSGGRFSSASFSHEMTMFSGFATGALSSTPGGVSSDGGSGSGGGGSSGGGGGGGGGGSW